MKTSKEIANERVLTALSSIATAISSLCVASADISPIIGLLKQYDQIDDAYKILRQVQSDLTEAIAQNDSHIDLDFTTKRRLGID